MLSGFRWIFKTMDNLIGLRGWDTVWWELRENWCNWIFKRNEEQLDYSASIIRVNAPDIMIQMAIWQVILFFAHPWEGSGRISIECGGYLWLSITRGFHMWNRVDPEGHAKSGYKTYERCRDLSCLLSSHSVTNVRVDYERILFNLGGGVCWLVKVLVIAVFVNDSRIISCAVESSTNVVSIWILEMELLEIFGSPNALE